MTHLIIWGAVLISIFKWILKRSRLKFAIRISTAQNVIRILICYIAKRFFVCFFFLFEEKKAKAIKKAKKIYKKIIEDSAWKMKGHTDTKPNIRDSFFFLLFLCIVCLVSWERAFLHNPKRWKRREMVVSVFWACFHLKHWILIFGIYTKVLNGI